MSVFEVPRPKRNEEHPTMKPVELVKLMLEKSAADAIRGGRRRHRKTEAASFRVAAWLTTR